MQAIEWDENTCVLRRSVHMAIKPYECSRCGHFIHEGEDYLQVIATWYQWENLNTAAPFLRRMLGRDTVCLGRDCADPWEVFSATAKKRRSISKEEA